MMRFIHLRITSRCDDPAALFAFLRQAIPFYEALTGIRIRLLRSVDDPSRFIEVVEYETQAVYEADQVRVSSDPAMRSYLSSWRALLQNGVEVETYEEVTDQVKGAGNGDG
jgi:hypothetical protein